MTNDLVTGQRTFYLGVSGLVNESITEIPFRDSAGNDIKCSYFRITGRGAGDVEHATAVVAELSGVSHTGNMVTDTLSAVQAAVPGKGICGVGFVGALGPGEAEWHGSNGQVCTGIKVKVQTESGAGVLIGVTYGNLFPLNSLRLEQSYDAGV